MDTTPKFGDMDLSKATFIGENKIMTEKNDPIKEGSP